MIEDTPTSNANFDGILADEIMRLNKIIKDLEIVIQNFKRRVEDLEAENKRLETEAYGKSE